MDGYPQYVNPNYKRGKYWVAMKNRTGIHNFKLVATIIFLLEPATRTVEN